VGVAEDSSLFKIVKEGKALLKVPNPDRFRDKRGFYDPAWAPVFYNPRMRVSRDLGSVIVGVYGGRRGDVRILDALAASGARGIRYAVENRGLVSKLLLNDINPLAARIARENIRLNRLEGVADVASEDAAVLMLRERGFDFLEIDPFGSPAPFTDPALRSVSHRGMACFTATDMPPLLGKYPKTSLRKYFSWSLRTEFSRELGTRILLYFIAREAAKLGRRAIPLYAHSTDHYIRVCVKVEKTKSGSGGLPGNIGYLWYCRKSLHRGVIEGIVPRVPTSCPSGGGKVEIAGPLWIGPLWDGEFAEAVYSLYMERMGEGYLSRKGLKIAELIKGEVNAPPFFYTTEALASRYSLRSEPSPHAVVESLSEAGVKASLTHFDPKGFRTNLPPEEIIRLIDGG